MVFASETYSKVNAYRAFESYEMKEIFEIGQEAINSFVSAKQVAGFE